MAVECTGLTAAWCPIHGDCTCPRSIDADGHVSGERPHMDADDCPLHNHTSTHPEGAQPMENQPMRSVLQDWVMELPLREQGTMLTAVRGCDDEAKTWTSTGVAYSPGRRLTAFLRWCCLNPADPREVDIEEGAFMRSEPPDRLKPSEFGHLPEHWYAHVMHAAEVIGYRHPDPTVAAQAHAIYLAFVRNLHLNPETFEQMVERLSEDRIEAGTVVS